MKSNAKSEILRNEGNQFYAQKNFFDGILKYNESLCCAEAESENMGLAYANRSAVYFEMKLYDKCLENIELAKKNHYPEKNLEILKKRESKCLDIIKQQRDEVKQTADALNFFKLSYPRNKNQPNIIDCLELKNDKTYGRHIVTNRSLRVGDVVVVEDPFCRIVQEKFVHQRCTICFKDELLGLLPCPNCQKAMFCKNCVKDASKSFHQFECPLVEVLASSVLSSSIRMAIRTYFVALSLFDGSVESFEKFMNENSDVCTVFDHGSSLASTKQKLLQVNSLITNPAIKVDEEIFEELFTATPILKDMWMSHQQFIRTFLKKQFQIGTLNYHEIYAWSLKKGGFIDDDVNDFKGQLVYKRGVVSTGNGSYPFSSLINHSCSPNLTRIFIDDTLILVVINPISKGEQVFDNYGYNFTNAPKEYRQSELLKQYRFKCNCLACANNWPLLPSMKVVDKACLNKAKKTSRELGLAGITQKKAIEKFKEIFSFIEKGQNNFPSLEVCSLQQSFSAYAEMITKPNLQFP